MRLSRKSQPAPLGPQWASGGVEDFGPGKTSELLGPLEMEEPPRGLINDYRGMVDIHTSRARRAAIRGVSALSVAAGTSGLFTGAMTAGPATTAAVGGILLPMAAYELELLNRKQ